MSDLPPAVPPVTSVPVLKRVRVELGGVTLADSLATRIVRGVARSVVYGFPAADVAPGCLTPAGPAEPCPVRGAVTAYDVAAGGRHAPAAAWRAEGPRAEASGFAGHVVFAWEAMDRWLEEDEQVFFHARDPGVRVDIVASGRRVRVTAGGVTVAETRRALFLFETGEPVCFYMPPADVRADLLVESDYLAGCPYKGQARHHHVRVGGRLYANAVYRYDDPVPECLPVRGLMCFDPACVDTIAVDPPARAF